MRVMSVVCGKGNVVKVRREFSAVDEMYFFLVEEMKVTHEFVVALVRKGFVTLDSHPVRPSWIRFECKRLKVPKPTIVPKAAAA